MLMLRHHRQRRRCCSATAAPPLRSQTLRSQTAPPLQLRSVAVAPPSSAPFSASLAGGGGADGGDGALMLDRPRLRTECGKGVALAYLDTTIKAPVGKAGPVLVAVNPFKDLQLYGNDFVTAYRQKLLDSPHVYSVADTAYNEMMTGHWRVM